MTLLQYIKSYSFVYTETQLWTFELTPIPGVFYIKLKASTNFITVPSFAKNGSSLTMEAKKGSYDSTQLWKFIPSSDGVNLLIQNYSLDGNGLVLDCNGGGVGKQLQLWSRNDNDNQKYYMSI